MPYIERIEVEDEGFLGGLDLQLDPGLNVLIGARGTGKTSLIELIRYALGAGAFTTDAAVKAEQQSVATLDGGAVTVTVRDGDFRWTVTRTAEGATSSTGPAMRCTVLAQNEVESIGISPAGRVALIDRFLPDAAALDAEIRASARLTSALTAEIAASLAELDKADEGLAEMPGVQAQLAEARQLQSQLLATSSASLADQEALTSAQAQASTLAQRESQLQFARNNVAELSEQIQAVRSNIARLDSDVSATLPSSQSIVYTRQAANRLAEVSDDLRHAQNSLDEDAARAGAERAQLDQTSRTVRQRLDQAQDGLSQATRRVQQLEERRGQLDALHARRIEFSRQLDAKKEQRRAAFDSLNLQRARRLQARQEVAARLTAQLGPSIRVRVTPGESLDAYSSAIIASLRGSGLHYTNLAPLIASQVAPQELVEWVELGDSAQLSTAAGLAPDRAANVIAAMRQGGTAAVIGTEVEDLVWLELLDGPEYKPVEHLSIGQRCTVVLPILLALEGEPLIVDQPEDHLDNAFVASTLISAIRSRGSRAQTVFSSHNANIPVLAEAERVVVMESDGVVGGVAATGALDEPNIVKAVSEIMEGGAEAFARRADFYRSGGSRL
jgi:hypothetical protein